MIDGREKRNGWLNLDHELQSPHVIERRMQSLKGTRCFRMFNHK